jgi:hypothetical protein
VPPYNLKVLLTVSAYLPQVIAGPGVASVDMERASRQIERSETAFYKLAVALNPQDPCRT